MNLPFSPHEDLLGHKPNQMSSASKLCPSTTYCTGTAGAAVRGGAWPGEKQDAGAGATISRQVAGPSSRKVQATWGTLAGWGVLQLTAQ